MLRTHHFPSSNILHYPPFISSHHFTHLPFPHSTTSLRRPLSAHSHRTFTQPWLIHLAEESSSTSTSPPSPPPVLEDDDEGPIELPSSSDSSIFSNSDSPTPLQTSASILLTGAIGVFLFRSLRRRAKRAKELKFRSSGATKSFKDEAMESLKAMTSKSTSIDAKAPPSPAQAFIGAVTAGVIALILYKFTTTIEASLNRQTMPDNFSVRQITVTIRTIINGLCYLATFVFGINSVGLFLYSGQLAFDSIINAGDDEAQSNSSPNSLGSEEPSSDEEPVNKD